MTDQNFDIDEINQKYLLGLKLSADGKKTYLEKLEIENYFLDILEKMAFFHNNKTPINEIKDYLTTEDESSKLSPLQQLEEARQKRINHLGKDQPFYGYCLKIDRPFQECVAEDLTTILDTYDNKALCKDIYYWIKNYNFEETYRKYEAQENTLLFSHRIYKETSPHRPVSYEFKLENDIGHSLKVQTLTSFGYGKSSFFEVIITYDKIELLRTVHWINNRNHRSSDPRWATFTFAINHGSWIEALEKIRDFCNLFLQDHDVFIRKITLEIPNQFVEKLEQIQQETDEELNEKYRLFSQDRLRNDIFEVSTEVTALSLNYIRNMYHNLFTKEEYKSYFKEFEKITDQIQKWVYIEIDRNNQRENQIIDVGIFETIDNYIISINRFYSRGWLSPEIEDYINSKEELPSK